MHKSLNRIFKTLKEYDINVNNGTHPAGYHKARMKSLQKPQRPPPSPSLPISIPTMKRKAYLCVPSHSSKIQIIKKFPNSGTYTPNP